MDGHNGLHEDLGYFIEMGYYRDRWGCGSQGQGGSDTAPVLHWFPGDQVFPTSFCSLVLVGSPGELAPLDRWGSSLRCEPCMRMWEATTPLRESLPSTGD